MLKKDALRKKINLCIVFILLSSYPIILISMNKDEKVKLSRMLYTAVLSGKPDEVISYIEKGASVEGVPRENKIPLIAAINGGHLEVVEVLLEHGANPNLQLSARYPCQTLLNLSLKPPSIKNDAITGALLDHGADPDAKNIYGEIPLRIAVNRRNERVVRLILKVDPKDERSYRNRQEILWAAINPPDEQDKNFYLSMLKASNEYYLFKLYKNKKNYFSLLPADIMRELVQFSSFDRESFVKLLQN